MANDTTERDEYLNSELEALDQETARLAQKFQALAGIDCSFGACVFDPEMDTVEKKIAEVQRRKQLLEGMIAHLESCES